MRQTLMAIGLVAIAGLAAQAADPTYHLVKEIQIGGTGGWDYITVDSAAQRIYVSHATKVVVADTGTGKVIGEIPDTPGVHGFAVAPDLGLGFTSNGRDNSSTVVDLKTLKAINKVMTGGNPDAILYEPVHHEVYTFNGSGQSATVFEAKTGTVIATIALMGKPEAAAFDRAVGQDPIRGPSGVAEQRLLAGRGVKREERRGRPRRLTRVEMRVHARDAPDPPLGIP